MLEYCVDTCGYSNYHEQWVIRARTSKQHEASEYTYKPVPVPVLQRFVTFIIRKLCCSLFS